MPLATVALTIQVDCTKTAPGDAVFICGSAPAIGSWKPNNAVPCSTCDEDYPTWTSQTILLPASLAKIEFKCLVQPATGGGQARWEAGGNRTLHLPRAASCTTRQVQLTATCVWEDAQEVLQPRIVESKTAPVATAESFESKPSHISVLPAQVAKKLHTKSLAGCLLMIPVAEAVWHNTAIWSYLGLNPTGDHELIAMASMALLGLALAFRALARACRHTRINIVLIVALICMWLYGSYTNGHTSWFERIAFIGLVGQIGTLQVSTERTESDVERQ